MSRRQAIDNFHLVTGLLAFCLMVGRPVIAHGQRASEKNHELVEPYSDPDSYQIYATLLSREKQSMFVISAELNWYPDTSVKDLGIRGGRGFMRDWKEALEDAALEHRKPRLLTHTLGLATPYELLTESEKAEIFSVEPPRAKWENFYRHYPSSKGYYWFSAVGFNRLRDRAIVYMGYNCGLLCAGDRPYFFEKQSGVWHEVLVKALISVGAS